MPRIVWVPRTRPTPSVFARLSTWTRTLGGLLEVERPKFTSANELIPRTEGAKSAREDAIGLLKLAAEVEHALMVQYLYAAWSIEPGGDQGGGDSAANLVGQIAVQEMFHLVAVQNLLIALGGVDALHLGRDSIRSASDDNPLPLVLERLDHAALAKYVVAEMPAQIDDLALRARVQELQKEAQQDAGAELNHVGAIYTALQWIFQKDDTNMEPFGLGVTDGYKAGWHLTQADFIAPEVIDKFAAKRQPWHAVEPDKKLIVVTNQNDGLQLIREISEQGEGTGPGEDSHFEHFVQVLDLLEKNAFSTRPVPVSPFASYPPPPDVKEKTEVVDPYTRLWCDWFDIRYTMLWHDIGHALSIPSTDANRRKLTALVFAQMRSGLMVLAKAVSSLPLDASGSRNAAPGFGLVFQTLPGPAGARQRGLDLAALEAEVTGHIKASPRFPGSDAASDAFDKIMGPGGFHEVRRRLLEQTT